MDVRFRGYCRLALTLHYRCNVVDPADSDPWIPHLLVVDDDEDMVEWLAELFASQGAVVQTAQNGTEALDKIAHEGTYNLVVTDVRMPAPGGLQLAAMARYAGYKVPFLIITAFPDSEVGRTVDRLDDAKLLPKPFKPQELWKAARDLVSVSQRGQSQKKAQKKAPDKATTE
jgi:DNA-binding NtrC family response regulator